MNVGSLFSGIGGFDLGFERAGMRTVWFCEQREFCQRVLAKHWPGVPCYPDVRALVGDADRSRENGNAAAGGPRPPTGESGGGAGMPVPVPYVDVLCGGFPCQDISFAGKGAGIGGARSGLWREFARLIGELRPRYVVVENVPALTSRGLDVVLADLAACGFDAEWDHLPASAFGAPHRRDRLWLVAYPDGDGRALADTARDASAGREPQTGTVGERVGAGGQRSGARDVADAEVEPVGTGLCEDGPGGQRRGRSGDGGRAGEWWLAEPDVGRVADGVPARVERLRGLGNSLVPQIAEWIGERIVSWEETRV